MLINLRNALMAGKRLPYDAEVEYLQSSGTQYINTGFTPTSNTSVEIGYKTADAQLNTVLFGRRVAYNNKSYCIWANANGKIRFDYALNTTNNANGPDYIARSWVDVSKRKERNYVNAIEYTANIATTFACDGNAYLFGMNDNGTANWLISAQISYCKIWDGDTLARDFVSVRKSGVGYLYDRVSGKLFGNAGTGDFVLGQDVVPVEYIESHGAEWIDTGYVYNADSEFVCDAMLMSVPSDVFATMFGAVQSYNGVSLALNNTVPIQARFGASSVGNIVSDLSVQDAVGVRHKYELSALRLAIDNSIFTRADFTPYTLYRTVWVCSCSDSDSGNLNKRPSPLKVFSFIINEDGTPVHNFRPVRVGTDATSWKGAMMDVLTRRIYRNVGTGAFGYGNDLKYPIPAS